MAVINPYLNFNGNTEEAFNFYKSVFGGDFFMLMRMGDVNNVPGFDNLAEADKNKIMHISLPIGKNDVLMGTDIVESLGQPQVGGNNFSIAIGSDSKEEADRLFNGLSNGGKITMPMADTFWGAYYGMFTDKFGIQWMVSYDTQNVPPNNR
jgi:PhnB protein